MSQMKMKGEIRYRNLESKDFSKPQGFIESYQLPTGEFVQFNQVSGSIDFDRLKGYEGTVFAYYENDKYSHDVTLSKITEIDGVPAIQFLSDEQVSEDG